MGNIDKDTFFLIFVILLSILFVSSPIIYFMIKEPGFIGFSLGQDELNYAHYANQSFNNLSPFFEDKYNSFYTDGRIINLFFWFIGLISLITSIDISVLFLLSKIIIVSSIAFLLWVISKELFSNKLKQKLFVLISIFGGGFGGIIKLASIFIPILNRLKAHDVSYSMSFSLLSSFIFFMAGLGIIFILLSFLFILRFFKKREIINLFLSSFFALVTFLVHPISAIYLFSSVLFVLLVFIFYDFDIKKISLLKEFSVFILPLLLIGVYIIWALQDSSFSNISVKYISNIARTIPVFWYITGYGLILLFAIYGIFKNSFSKNQKITIVAFLLAAILLAQNPWKGIRFQQYLIIPLSIFATEGFVYVASCFKKQNLKSWFLVVSVFVLFSSIPFLYLDYFNSVGLQSDIVGGPYLADYEKEIFSNLNQLDKGLVFSDLRLSSFIPVYSQHSVFTGFWGTTINYSEKNSLVNLFFENKLSMKEMKNILYSNNINYLVFCNKEIAPIGDLFYKNNFCEIRIISYK